MISNIKSRGDLGDEFPGAFDSTVDTGHLEKSTELSNTINSTSSKWVF